jgi:methyltransferase (TIGR00027 family)
VSTDQWDITSGVGVTAVAVAAGRAKETESADRLISDPYADALVTAANLPTTFVNTGRPKADEVWETMSRYMGVRTRYFDDWFARAGDDGIRQAVILASGLDTRAFRLSWPAGTNVYEIDQPKVLEFKDTVLNGLGAQPACHRTPIPVDLRDDWEKALTEAGFDATQPTAWLAEGLLPYLPAAAEQQLIDTITRLSAPGSHLCFEAFTTPPDFMDDPELQEIADELGINFSDLISKEERPDPSDQLQAQGWSVHREPGNTAAARYGRELNWDLFENAPDEPVIMLTGRLQS